MPELRDMLTPDVLAGLDAYIKAQQEPETPPQAINGILADWLSGHGYLPVEEMPEGEE